MQKIGYFLFAISALALAVAACGESSAPSETESTTAIDLKSELPGTWDAVSFKFILHSVNSNPELDTILETKEEEWANRYLTHPPRTYFLFDNKYRKEFRMISGDTLDSSRGMWNVFGDTLLLVETDTSYQFLVKIDKGLAEFSRILDADGDGEVDDEYIEIHRRVSRSVEN